MKRLLNFIFRFRGLFTFIFLEVVCFYLIVQNNRYQRASFFSSANFLAASITQTSNNVQEYFLLKTNNRLLAEENAQLKKELELLKSLSYNLPVDEEQLISKDSTDSISQSPYNFITAKVINNSIYRRNNTLTINKGSNDGVEPGMGVVGDNGLVGKVKYTSGRFSVVTSLLHSGFTVSSRIKNKVEVCTTEWNGEDPKLVQVKYVPRYHEIEVGDTVMTSGYNSVFPADYVIGIIVSVDLQDDANFYDISAEIINDFSRLSYVHVIANQSFQERDSLENITD